MILTDQIKSLKFGVISVLTILFLAAGIIAGVCLFSESDPDSNRMQPYDAAAPAGSFLLRITDDIAGKIDLRFQAINAIAGVLAKQAAYYLSHSDIYGNIAGVSGDDRSGPNSPDVRESFMTPSVITSDISEKMRALSHIDILLKDAKNIYPECMTSFVVTDFFAGRFYPEMLPHFSFFISKIESFENVSDVSDSGIGRTDFFTADDGSASVAGIAPIFSGHHFSGFAGIAVQPYLLMNGILGKSSHQTDVSVQDTFSFLFDKSGNVSGLSSVQLQLMGLNPSEGDAVRTKRMADSSNESVREFGQRISGQDRETGRIVLDNTPYLIAVRLIPSAGVRVAVGMPESVIIQSLGKNFAQTETESELPVVIAILLFIVFCVVGVSMFLFVRSGKVISAPEKRKDMILITDEMIEEEMNIRTHDNDDELTDCVDLIQEDETGTLAHSYNKMVEALQKINELEKKHSVELADANRQLQKEILERERAEHEIRLLSRRLINSIEEGRRELARDLHDEFGQMLAAMHLDAEFLSKTIPSDMVEIKEKIEALIVLIEQLGDKIRNVSSELRPDLLDDLGLVPTLEWYIKEFSNNKPDIQIDFQAAGFKKRLSSDIEIALYRIFQECMNNIVKHANARHVGVMLTYNYPKVILMVKDDGAGFDTTRRADGIGLAGMQERAVSANGQIEIRSTIGKGSAIRAELPIS